MGHDIPVFAYAHLNARIMPVLRGKLFETPLEEALKANGLGEVGGGGTMQLKSGEIEYCGIDVDLFDVERGSSFVCNFLNERGAPKGSRVAYEHDGQSVSIAFGVKEGLAVYLNGTDLPEEVYKTSDVNLVIEAMKKLLKTSGDIHGWWQGPRETALYFYGDSAEKMRQIISPVLNMNPLCEKARVEQIA